MGESSRETVTYKPGQFEAARHFYPRVLNAQIHPLVRYFLSLDQGRIVERYCHLHPKILPAAVDEVLSTRARHFRWGGSDLFHATTRDGERRIVVIETNSSPSGQKSSPMLEEGLEMAGYKTLLEQAFIPIIERRKLPPGDLAVLYDKNEMETSGYAAALADLTGEPVHYVPFFEDQVELPEEERTARFVGPERCLEVKVEGAWRPVRAALRYVTQRPWNRIPLISRTALLNPVLTCLAGGRNKLLAAKAYDLYNAEMRQTGLSIRFPETIWDVSREEIPMWVRRMGGFAVVKNPYSNAGQGVWTITSDDELDAFMELSHRYERFIVQSLIGNADWSSESLEGRFYHVGTVPDRRNRIFVADLRFMIGNGPDGFFPVAIYARRARSALVRKLSPECSSWGMLGTNLSVRTEQGWVTEPERLMLMDSRDFNRLGLGLDDLIEAYIQTILSVLAIDRMAANLVTQKKTFRKRFFKSLNPDASLLQEICA